MPEHDHDQYDNPAADGPLVERHDVTGESGEIQEQARVCGVEVWRRGTRREPNGQGDSRWAAPPQWDDRSRGRWFGRVAPCDCHGAWYPTICADRVPVQSRPLQCRPRGPGVAIEQERAYARARRQRQPLTAALNRDTMGGRQLLSRGTRYGTLVFGAGQPPAAGPVCIVVTAATLDVPLATATRRVDAVITTPPMAGPQQVRADVAFSTP